MLGLGIGLNVRRGAGGDAVAPTLSSPVDAATGATTGSGSVTTDEGNGTLYWVVTTSSTGPSAAQVKAGNDHTGAAAVDSGSQVVSTTGAQVISGGFTGLTAATQYFAHYMHEDDATNQSSVASGDGLTTFEASPGGDFHLIGTVERINEVDAGPQNLTLPAETTTGDVVVLITGADTSIDSPPDGYTALHTAGLSYFVGYKVMGETPDTTVACPSAASRKSVSIAQVWRGADPSTPVDNSFSETSGTSGMPNPPGHTTVSENTLRIVWGWLDDDDVEAQGAVAAPTGYSNLAVADTGQASTSTGCGVMLASKFEATTTGDDPDAFTGGAQAFDDWHSGHFALRPAP